MNIRSSLPVDAVWMTEDGTGVSSARLLALTHQVREKICAASVIASTAGHVLSSAGDPGDDGRSYIDRIIALMHETGQLLAEVETIAVHRDAADPVVTIEQPDQRLRA